MYIVRCIIMEVDQDVGCVWPATFSIKSWTWLHLTATHNSLTPIHVDQSTIDWYYTIVERWKRWKIDFGLFWDMGNFSSMGKGLEVKSNVKLKFIYCYKISKWILYHGPYGIIDQFKNAFGSYYSNEIFRPVTDHYHN